MLEKYKNMIKLSKNLSVAEFEHSDMAKRHGLNNSMSLDQIEVALVTASRIFQPVRDHFGVPIYVSSGFRGDLLNDLSKFKYSMYCFLTVILT